MKTIPLVVALAACAAGPVRPAPTIVHLRALAGASPTELALVELLDDGTEPPALSLLAVQASGEGRVLAAASPEEAAGTAVSVRGGTPLLDALPASILAARDAAGLTPPGPGEPLPLAVTTAAGAGTVSLELRPAPPGTSWALVLRQDDIGVPLAEPGPGERPLVSVHVLGPALAAAEVSLPSEKARIVDVVPLDLGRAAGLILLARSQAQPDDRLELLARAEAAAPREPAVAYARALALAGTRDDAAAAAELSRALALGGEAFRMRARAEPAFRRAPYDALTRPAPLPGTNRAGGGQ